MNSLYENRSIDINQADWNICSTCQCRVKTSAHDNTKCKPVAYCNTHKIEFRGICGSCIGGFGYFD